MKNNRELLFSLTSKDFEFSYTKGSGKGGQKRNKTSSAVYCKHPPSNSIGYSESTRSQRTNKEEAFQKCVTSDSFKKWHRLEVSRKTGQLDRINKKVEEELKKIKVEVRESGKWVEESYDERINSND